MPECSRSHWAISGVSVVIFLGLAGGSLRLWPRVLDRTNMSLAIDVDRINRVLLADGWHAVKGGSFTLDSYEYIDAGPEYNPDLDDLQMGKEQFERRARQTLHGGGRIRSLCHRFRVQV